MKPIASLSLDLDNKWSYLKTHGDQGWESFPSYLDIVVPRVLAYLRSRNLTITVFIVGQDAAIAANIPALRAISGAGHEIGNHSFHHDPWLHLYTEADLEREIERAELEILEATGQRPIGFRGPGFSVSGAVLRVLARRDYCYDASTLPTFLGPLARAYYFFTAKLTMPEREKRAKLFGGLLEGLRPLRPYSWDVGNELLEIPVTTIPGLRLPFHLSYILYLSTFSTVLALSYFRAAVVLCRAADVSPSLLLHPLDFLASNEAPELQFFPAMGLTLGKKLDVIAACLDILGAHYTVVTVREHAAYAAKAGIARLEPVSECR